MALLRAYRLHLSEHGRDVVDDASFELTGARALILGAPRALFAALLEKRLAQSGELSCEGPLIHAGAVEILPGRWTALEWLIWRLRLDGMHTNEARRRSSDAFDAFELGAHRDVALAKAPPLLKHALPLVAAVAADPQQRAVVAFEDAFSGLDDSVAHYLAATFVRLLGARRWIGFLPLLSARSPLAEAADEVLVFDGGRVLSQGTPAALRAAERTFVVRVLGTELLWPDALRELDVELTAERPWIRPEGAGRELTVTFGERAGPSDLLALTAHSADVIVDIVSPHSKLL